MAETQSPPKEITQEIMSRIERANNEASAIINTNVTTVAEFNDAAEDLKTIKGYQKALDGIRRDLVDPKNAEVKAINDFFRGPMDFLKRAEDTRKRQLTDFQRAEQERQRKAQEAEARRLEKLAEQRAQRADAKGDADRAEQERMDAEQQAAMVRAMPTEAPKVKGISSRTDYDFEVSDKMALIKAVAAGTAPLVYLDINDQAIRKVVKALGMDAQIPGIVVKEKTVVAARSA